MKIVGGFLVFSLYCCAAAYAADSQGSVTVSLEIPSSSSESVVVSKIKPFTLKLADADAEGTIKGGTAACVMSKSGGKYQLTIQNFTKKDNQFTMTAKDPKIKDVIYYDVKWYTKKTPTEGKGTALTPSVPSKLIAHDSSGETIDCGSEKLNSYFEVSIAKSAYTGKAPAAYEASVDLLFEPPS